MRLPEHVQTFDGMPWGLGAISVREVAPGYVFPCCDKRAKRNDSVHVYVDGDVACTHCAREWVATVWNVDEDEPIGQASMFGGAA